MKEYCIHCDAECEVIEHSSIIDSHKSVDLIKRTQFTAYHCALCNSFLYSETEDLDDFNPLDEPDMPSYY